MHAELQAHVAFHLTGKRPASDLDAVENLQYRHALLAPYQDLARLRYDFPLVLVRDAAETGTVMSLSRVMNDVLREIAAPSPEGEKLRKHVLRLEQEMRREVAAGASGSLSSLWKLAASRLGAADTDIAPILERAQRVVQLDGEIIDCNEGLPGALLQHVWQSVQDRKRQVFRKTVNRLIQRLSDILRSDFMHSEDGQSATQLKAGVGEAHAEIFDFEAMSRLLGKGLPRNPLPITRQQRVESALAVLKAQRFFDVPERHAERGHGAKTHGFTFDSCGAALKAYHERLPEMIELAKAIAIAELEAEGLYVGAQHDAFFRDYGEDMLEAENVAMFPDYFVRVRTEHLQPAEHERLTEILSSALPMKILLQTDDLLAEAPLSGTRPAFGRRTLQFARAAMDLSTAYVVQAAASHLYQFRGRLLEGMQYAGPSFYSVYSGAAGIAGGLPAYLSAAAAMECRAFPAYVYDPSAGPTLAARFFLDDNPDLERDWPVRPFVYEDDAHQAVSEDLAFTFVDFVACDPRYGHHFARVPHAKWDAAMASVAACLGDDGKTLAGKVPCVQVVDTDNRLHKLIVDEKLLKEARRCREIWRGVQELGGIHNSHAERLLARERKAWETAQAAVAAAQVQAAAPSAVQTAAAPAAAPAPAEPAAEEEKSDDPYIETARCSSCNECIQLNNKMFAYDGNNQAYIANPDAGTYRELVEAAESCQVSVIHPGKPRNPNEPGLEELLARAEPFL